MRADLLVNRAFQPFCFFRNRSSEGRSKPPGKPRGYPSTQSSDSIEARKLTDPTNRSKKLFQTLAPNKTPKTPSPKPVGPARLRARRRYTRRSSNWQAAKAAFPIYPQNGRLCTGRGRALPRRYIGAQAFCFLRGLSDLAFDHVADRDDAGQPLVQQ